MSSVDHRFRMTLDDHGDRDVEIVVRGDFDRAGVGEFEDAATRRLEGGSRVTADITGVSLIDSAALAALVRLHRLSADHDGRFDIAIGPAYQRRLFDIAGLSTHLNLVQQPPKGERRSHLNR